MFSRLFRRSSSPKIDPVWWQAADAAAEAPTSAAVESLAVSLTPTTAASDEVERQQEMLSGLRDLVELASSETLPVISTQHRAIGQDRCHFIAPVSLGIEGGGAGKLFLTSARLVFVGGRLRSWPWHRVRKIARVGRNLIIVIAGEGEDLLLQCNTYGEALVAGHLIKRLMK